VVTDFCTSEKAAVTCFNTVEALYHHYSKPAEHMRLRLIQNALGIKMKELNSLSSTRWSCRYKNCEAKISNFGAISSALEEEISENADKDAIEAKGVYASLMTGEFVVCLFVLKDILQKVYILSRYFQKIGATLGRAATFISGFLADTTL